MHSANAFVFIDVNAVVYQSIELNVVQPSNAKPSIAYIFSGIDIFLRLLLRLKQPAGIAVNVLGSSIADNAVLSQNIYVPKYYAVSVAGSFHSCTLVQL